MHKNATKLVQLMVENSFFSRFFGLFGPFFSFFFGPTSVIFKKKVLATLHAHATKPHKTSPDGTQLFSKERKSQASAVNRQP